MGDDGSRSYLNTALRIAVMIHCGTLRPAERLPSLRQISRHRNISLATALQAYRWLEDRELIFSRPGSGFYVASDLPVGRNPDLSDIVGSDHPSLFSHSPNHTVPDWQLPCAPAAPLMPGRRISRIIGSMARRHPFLIAEPGPALGEPELRRQIARRAMAYGCEPAASDIIVTTGEMEAITLALRAVTMPGDLIAVESPCSSATLKIITQLGLEPIEIPATAGQGICIDRLESALGAHDIRACLFTTNCADPLGYVMSDGLKGEIMRLLERRGIPLVENDILGELAYDERPRLASSFARTDNTLICSSFAYTLGSGLGLGWIVPGRYMGRVLELKVASSVTPPALMQRAVAEYLRGSGFDRHVRRLRRALKDQGQRLAGMVEQHFPSGSQVHQPRGGAALWVELPSSVDAEALHAEAQPHQVDFVPGTRFTAGNDYRHCLRLCSGEPWSNGVEIRVQALGDRAAELQAGGQIRRTGTDGRSREASCHPLFSRDVPPDDGVA